MNNLIDQIDYLFQSAYNRSYGEELSIVEHSLQSAYFAQCDSQTDEMILACLLHDIGHFLHPYDEDCADKLIDTRHEELAFRFLKNNVSDAVCYPIKYHVVAKRYLAKKNQSYFDKLSFASKQSLKLQGGPLTDRELSTFESLPFHQEALTLRAYDEKAKVVGLEVPKLNAYRPLMQNLFNGVA